MGTLLFVALLTGCGQQPSASNTAPRAASPVASPALAQGAPPAEALRRYDLPAPVGVRPVGHLVDDDWSGGALFLEVAGDRAEIDAYLRRLGTRRSALAKGYVPIDSYAQREAGWSLDRLPDAGGGSATLSPGAEGTVCDLVLASAGQAERLYLVAEQA
ncbi:hypothetical protein [Streptomyces sp. NPDC048200]|uniref:hypothetical protein n=1 Tax=Streptomyces sp. NPDC048200 TaxID=3365512 RepID=UPI00371B7FFF